MAFPNITTNIILYSENSRRKDFDIRSIPYYKWEKLTVEEQDEHITAPKRGLQCGVNLTLYTAIIE